MIYYGASPSLNILERNEQNFLLFIISSDIILFTYVWYQNDYHIHDDDDDDAGDDDDADDDDDMW